MTMNIFDKYQAYCEFLRIQDLSAFNVQGYVGKTGLNQHCTRYVFPDNSVLKVNSTRGIAQFYREKEGACLARCRLKINR